MHGLCRGFRRLFSVLTSVLVVCLCGLFGAFGFGERAASSLAWADEFSVIDTVSLTGLDPVAANPYGITFHPSSSLAYVALAGEPSFTDPSLTNGRSVVELDLNGGLVRTFTVGLFPTELAITSDGADLFASCSTDSVLSKIDLVTGTVTPIALTDSLGGTVGFPTSVHLSLNEQEVWVLSNGGDFDGSDENIVIVDRATGNILRRETLAGSMSRAALLSDGRFVLPVGFPGNDFTATPELRILDTSTVPWTTLATLPMTVDTSAFPGPIDVVVSADESRAYVSVFEGSSEVFVVDLVNQVLLPSIPLPVVDNVQHGLELTPDGLSLFVTDFFANQARVVDLATGAVSFTIATGDQPNSVEVRGGRAWITNQAGVSLTLVELPGAYIRGDVNADGGVDLADGIGVLDYLFQNGAIDCLDRADVDDSGTVTVGDAVTLFGYLFSSGAPPMYPFPDAGADVTLDMLECNL